MFDTWRDQKVWSDAADQVRALRFDREASSRLAALRLLQSGPHAGSWLTALPGAGGSTAFSAAAFQVLLRFRCGIPFPARALCGGCSTVLDAYGDHALCCTCCGLYNRHNILRDTLADEFRLAGYQVTTEEPLPGAGERPADVFLAVAADGLPDATDVSVGHPLQLSLPLAEVAPGALAERLERAKSAASVEACRRAGWHFTQACAETTGAWGPSARALVRKLARRQSMRCGIPLSEAASRLWRRLTVAVMQGAATMLLRAYPVLQEGLESPEVVPGGPREESFD